VKKFTFTKLELLKLVGISIKSATAIIGGSLILVEGHPYLSIAILALGGVANEVVSFIKEKENEKNTTNNDTIIISKQP
jgi:hypothetical protein